MFASQIDSYCRQDKYISKIYGGVLNSDTSKNLKHDKAYVINNVKSTDRDAGHWVLCLFSNISKDLYFNSLGGTNIVSDIEIHFQNTYETNNLRVQGGMNTCGQHVLFVLYHLSRFQSLRSVMDMYSHNLYHNDNMVILFHEKTRYS